jgi:murein DD-endopeptidase MepM/ murein hydrolase activator NlpD
MTSISARLFCALLLAAALLGPGPAPAAQETRLGVTLEWPETVVRGEPFFVRLRSERPATQLKVRWLGRELGPELEPAGAGWRGEWLLGWGLKLKDPVNTLRVQVTTAAGQAGFSKAIRVKDREFPEQHLTVSRKYTSLSEEDLARHRREKELVGQALARRTPTRMWQYPFVRPVAGGVSSEFGLKRFFNGEPRSPHSGVDLRGAAGTPVKATAAGRVALTGDHFFAGRSVYIDHGQGVISMYFHLSEIAVQEGQAVAAGEVVGSVGQSGRVTGPHLHFGVYAMGQRIDPLVLVEGRVGRTGAMQ